MPRRNRPTKKQAAKRPQYSRYYGSDYDTEPALVLIKGKDGENYLIKHPNGTEFWTHLHNLGRAS